MRVCHNEVMAHPHYYNILPRDGVWVKLGIVTAKRLGEGVITCDVIGGQGKLYGFEVVVLQEGFEHSRHYLDWVFEGTTAPLA